MEEPCSWLLSEGEEEEEDDDRMGELTARAAAPPPCFTASAWAAEGLVNQPPQHCGLPWQSKPWPMCSETPL